MSTTQFDTIYHGLTPDVGKLRLASQGIAWKSLSQEGSGTTSQVAIPAGDVKWAQWLRVARNFQLRIGVSKDAAGKGKSDRATRETFDGFSREDYDKLSQLMKQHYNVTVETTDISFKGWNWGVTDFRGDDLAFLVSNKTAFEVPLSSVSNSNIAGKTEVSLEFIVANGEHADKNKKVAKPPDELVEIRFYVPGAGTQDDDSVTQARKAEAKEKRRQEKAKNKEGKEGSAAEESSEEEEEEEEDQSAAQQFHSLVRERASLTSQTAGGALLISFDDILITTPRGRYDIDMYQAFLRLRGKTYDYKIGYTAITRLFLLPKDEQHVQFVVGLDPPIRQGQTRYSYLVMQFARDQEMEAELDIEEDLLQEKYAGKLEKHYDQPAFQVVSSIFRALSGKKIIGQTRDEAQGIKCNLKANPGELHLLEKSVIFVGKQPIVIDFNDVHQVVFSRVGNAMGTARTFDLSITPKSGAEYTFNAVNRDEHESMETYLKAKKVKVTNQMADDLLADLGVDDDDDDEEMQSVASSGEDEPTVRRGADVDEDSEEDADFQASSSDGGSPSSDDSEGSDAGSDADDKVEKSKPKAKSKPVEKQKPTKEKSISGEKSKQKAKQKPKKKDESDVEMGEPKKKAKESEHGSPPSAKPKPKPKAKAKPKEKAKDDDPMDVDASTSSPSKTPAKPKPRPKPKVAPDNADSTSKKSSAPNSDGPVKKKQKTDDAD